MSQDNDNDKKIVAFPQKKERKAIAKGKARASKDQEAMEEHFRSQYRRDQKARSSAQNAMMMGANARNSARGKQPMVNWDKIPFFSRLILGFMIAIHIVMSVSLDSGETLQAYYYLGFTPAIYTGAAPFHVWALINPITSIFIHGGWMHLLFNCVMLTVMTIFFERQYGMKPCVIFFFLCGLGGNLFYLLINPFSTMPVVGASGAISGLFAVVLLSIMSNSAQLGIKTTRQSPLIFIALWSVILIGFGTLGKDVSWQSHLGGFYTGAALYYLWKRGIIRI